MFVFAILTILFLVLWLIEKGKVKKSKKETDTTKEMLSKETARADALSQYQQIIDAEAAAKEILEKAELSAVSIKDEAQAWAKTTKQKATDTKVRADQTLASAEQSAKDIIAVAKKEAEAIAADALDAKANAAVYEEAAQAMKNIVKGYGDEWIKPTYSLLDDLAKDFGHTEAGQRLKEARDASANMTKLHMAAECDYVEDFRKQTAIDFVVDAFNGKVDSILSKVKKDNYGKLEQQIKDAFALVNLNGKAFRNARIKNTYLDARLEELRWAVIAQELRAKELEEQREIKERMREEEKARREIERAQREAEKEEAMLKKAMEKAQEQLAKASEAQKAQYEAQLAELAEKLREAEEKGQRAISMAQQTKHGNVYVISNIGSFGENVYKVGMTRRWNPMERISELSDASVPFQFDVHALIESDDAPALEHLLHQELAIMQMNKVNPRKEFFRVSLSDIKALVEKHGYTSVVWTMAAEAAEYRETLAIDERMKNDPVMKEKWLSFAESVRPEDSNETESA